VKEEEEEEDTKEFFAVMDNMNVQIQPARS
jgi:hypothetical protein